METPAPVIRQGNKWVLKAAFWLNEAFWQRAETSNRVTQERAGSKYKKYVGHRRAVTWSILFVRWTEILAVFSTQPKMLLPRCPTR